MDFLGIQKTKQKKSNEGQKRLPDLAVFFLFLMKNDD